MNLQIESTNDICFNSNTFESVTRKSILRLLKPIQSLSMATLLISAIFIIQHYPFGGEIVLVSQTLLAASTLLIVILTQPKTYGHWAAFIGIILFVALNLNYEVIDSISKYLIILISICIVIYYWDIGMSDGTVISLGIDEHGNKIQEIAIMVGLGSFIVGLILKLNDSMLSVMFFAIGILFAIIWAALYIRNLSKKG